MENEKDVNKCLFFTPTIYSTIYSPEILSGSDTGLPFDLEFPSKPELPVIRRAIEMSGIKRELVKVFPQRVCGRSEFPSFCAICTALTCLPLSNHNNNKKIP